MISIVEREDNRVDIVTNFHSVNGVHMNFRDIPTDANVNWTNLLRGLCDAVRYLHEKLKVLHNDIKSNNIVLDGCNLTEAVAVLVDFGKATHQSSTKIYHTPADIRKFKHLAPELGQTNAKQSKGSDIYSLGYTIKSLKRKFPNLPAMFDDLYRYCMRSSPSRRPSASYLCNHL